MADNTQLNVGTAGDLIRSVDKLGKKTQVVTLDLGGIGAESIVAGTLPVSGSVSVANFPASQTVALDTASLAALESISVQNFPATQAVSGTVALDAPSLAALENISVQNFPANVALTNTELRATPVPVSGAFFQVTQPVSNASLPLPTGATTETTLQGVRTDLGTDGTTPPALLGAGTGVRGWLRSIYEKLTGTIAVTGTFFQATQPVSIAASVAVTGPLTDTQIRATALPVSGAFFQASQPVSLAINTPDIIDRAGRLIGTISNTGFNVTGNSLVSTANSTAVALAANIVFTGTAEDISEYSTIMVTVFADQASATDGLSIQQSSNGTNWDLADVYSVPASQGKTFSTGVQAKFFRVVYTNGATASTVMRLQTIYSKASKKNSSVRPQDGRTNDNDFEENMAFGMVYNGTTWDRLRGSAATGLNVNGAFFQATQPVSGAFFQATQPVSLATNTPTLAAGTAIAGKFGIDQTTPHVTNLVTIQASTLAVTVTAAANTAATATLPAVAGQFHYITGIEIMRTSTAALAGTATLVVTTTNLPGGLAWSFGNAMAAGATQRDLMVTFENPLKSSVVNTATTIVMPLPGAAVLWRANVYYYTAA